MAKKLYLIGFDTIKSYISQNKDLINKNIINKDKYELSKVFGRGYYEIAIKDFFDEFQINKNQKYALQVLNIFKSSQFVEDLYAYLDLACFENEVYIKNLNVSGLKDYRKSIFYSFVYFIFTDINPTKVKIQKKLFSYYFLHQVSTINAQSDTQLNYKEMSQAYVKGKNIEIKESYKIDENTQNVTFIILLNKNEK